MESNEKYSYFRDVPADDVLVQHYKEALTILKAFSHMNFSVEADWNDELENYLHIVAISLLTLLKSTGKLSHRCRKFGKIEVYGNGWLIDISRNDQDPCRYIINGYGDCSTIVIQKSQKFLETISVPTNKRKDFILTKQLKNESWDFYPMYDKSKTRSCVRQYLEILEDCLNLLYEYEIEQL